MKLWQTVTIQRNASRAFTLVEICVAMALIGIVLAGMLGGLTWVTSSVQWTREDVRATQLMEEKLDTLRLYSWDQLNTAGFIQTNFVATFSTSQNGTTTNTAGSLTYNGTVTIATVPLTEAYSNGLKQVTVDLNWVSGSRPRHARMSTFVAQYGMQSFVY